MEQDLVPKSGIPMDAIAFSGMRGKGLAHTVRAASRCWPALPSAASSPQAGRGDGHGRLRDRAGRPDGAPAGVPLVLVNADAALLLSNKTLVPLAQQVCFGFPADFGSAAGKAVVTGNPVRAEILAMAPPAARFAGRSGPLRILVVGGSLGAKALNDSLPAALALMPEGERPLVTHQSGKKNIDALHAAYAQAGVQANVVDFIDDMARPIPKRTW
jgi:UDP-N-acetylglucosamine--N-acetylmuramyl-(pentapeptide) pyrophosphoryl-undecaprenol N-acetylglucosamine transferase